MYRCLISAGCSFAYGFNLPNRDKRYARLLADHMKVELVDTSMAGASNETLAAAAIAGINKSLERYKPEEIILLIGWTSTERFEFFNKRRGHLMSSVANLKHHRNGDKNPYLKEIHLFNNKYLWDPSFGYYKLVHTFNYVHSFCKSHGIKVIHKQNLDHYQAFFPDIQIKNAYIHNTDLIKSALSPEFARIFKDWTEGLSFQRETMRLKYILQPGYDTHPNEEGHYMWFNHLIMSHNSLNPK